MANLATEKEKIQRERHLFSETVYVPDRPVDSHREASIVQWCSHVAHSVAFEKYLAYPGGVGGNHLSLPKSLHPHLDWWLDKGNVLSGQPLHPLCHTLQLFKDAANEVRVLHRKRPQVSARKPIAHKFPRIEGSPANPH